MARDNPQPPVEGTKIQGDEWLMRANQAFEVSTSFIDNNYRQAWENNIRHFKNQHHVGSKYLSDAYKYRSKVFRPKTRAMVRNNESAAAAAFFQNLDLISIDPDDEKDPLNKAGAELRQAIINDRLNFGIPWFLTCVGGMQEAQVCGVVCSKQYWEFQEEEVEMGLFMGGQQVIDAETGEPVVEKQTRRIKDKPTIKLLPVENLRIDPASDWTDPVNSSPYVIAMEPMYIGDVKERIKRGEWENIDEKILLSARNAHYDSTRKIRNNQEEETSDARFSKPLTDFDIVWVHENLMRIAGQEVHYYTLGVSARLSKPRPLAEVYLHDERPFVIGTCVIEAHRPIPDALAGISSSLQKETNEIANSRLDNVKLVINKRYIVKRGKQVDLQSLVRNAAGSVTLATDTDDVEPIEFNDVTSSSYQEQDRLNVDFDELVGNFSSGSVQTNRKLNETVGGMAMLRQGSNQLTQYLIRVFSETWVEKVLRQLDKLEQFYESDMEYVMRMARKAGLEKYGLEQLDPQLIEMLLTAPCKVTVNVANSAADPIIRLDQFLMAVQKYTEVAQNAPPDLDLQEVKKEIFGRLGYRDGRRFTKDEKVNAQVAQLLSLVQQLQAALESKTMEKQQELAAKAEISRREQEIKAMIESMKAQAAEAQNVMEIRSQERIAQAQEQTKLWMAEQDRNTKEFVARLAEQTKILIAAMQAQSQAKQQEGEEKRSESEKGVNKALDMLGKLLEQNQEALGNNAEAMKGLSKAISRPA